MTGEWRSAAAQTFVGGRITQVDGYWPASSLAADVFELIADWDLWNEAFGAKAKKVRERWKTMLVLRNGVSSASGALRKVGGVLRGKNEVQMGTELLQDLKMDVVGPLQKLMTDAPLTINFDATSWFATRAGFDEYITMWDRKTTDEALTANPDAKNPAHVRAKADRHALYGQFDDGKAKLKSSGLQLPHVKKEGGVTSAPSWNYSASKPLPAGGAADSQVFAALNYGRRPHGSNTEYGKSVFELDNGFKNDAIYFAMDTFTPISTGSGFKSKAERSRLYQVSHNTFGGAILLAIGSQYKGNPSATNLQNSKELAADLLQSARNGNPRADNDENHLLLEAHIFRKVMMDPRSVVRVKISRSECGTALGAVQANAAAFQARTRVAVEYID